MTLLAEIMDALADLAPKELASPGDNVGLLLGDPAQKVRRAVVGLDLSRALLAKAQSAQAQLCLVHHPLIYNPLHNLVAGSHVAELATRALRGNIAVAALHTNLDYAPGGVNDRLATALGIKEAQPLVPLGEGAQVKLVVFVPEASETAVRGAIVAAGAGEIGKYRECTFRVAGKGTFRPQAGARPAAGRVGRLEETAEVRLEAVVARSRLGAVLRSMLEAHPYEEAAYDIMPLQGAVPGAGQGRIGLLDKAMTVKSLAGRAGRKLRAKNIRISGDAQQNARKAAVSSGSAKGFVERARRAGAEVLVAGEVPHHERVEAAEMGPALIELGHAESERVAVWVIGDFLEARFAGKIEVIRYDP